MKTKKRPVIRFVCFLLFFSFVSGFYYIKCSSLEKEKDRRLTGDFNSGITRLCSCFENISSAFGRADIFDDYTKESKNIYASCVSALKLLTLCEFDTRSLTEWLTELKEYSFTDMEDNAKNTKYREESQKALGIFICVLQNNNGTFDVSSLENAFETEKAGTDNYEKYKEKNAEYSTLSNYTELKRAAIGDLAKKILNYPIPISNFRGNYSEENILSYSLHNSYIDFFEKGGLLRRMSTETEMFGSHPVEDLYAKAKEYLSTYAPYASECGFACNMTKGNTLYCLFCPLYYQGSVECIDYSENIMIAVSLSDGTLKSFDSSDFLKNHSSEPFFPEYTLKKQNEICKNDKILSFSAVKIGDNFYSEYKTDIQGKIYYVLCDEKGDKKLYTEEEHFLFVG